MRRRTLIHTGRNGERQFRLGGHTFPPAGASDSAFKISLLQRMARCIALPTVSRAAGRVSARRLYHVPPLDRPRITVTSPLTQPDAPAWRENIPTRESETELPHPLCPVRTNMCVPTPCSLLSRLPSLRGTRDDHLKALELRKTKIG
jgi:hypothetical protein